MRGDAFARGAKAGDMFFGFGGRVTEPELFGASLFTFISAVACQAFSIGSGYQTGIAYLSMPIWIGSWFLACRCLRSMGWWVYVAAPILFGFICTVAALLPAGLGLMLNGDPQHYVAHLPMPG
jgi:hypothetical protein